APLLGRWSDTVGRKRILLLSQGGTFLAWVLFILALSLPRDPFMAVDSSLLGTFSLSIPLLLLFFARALDGLTGGNVSVANAYLSDISTDVDRKANFGKMASSTSLGFIVGPAAASLLAATVYQELLPVIAAAVVSLLAIFVIQRYLPESRQDLVPPDLSVLGLKKLFQIEQKECYQVENCPETGLRGILREPDIPLLFAIYFFTFLGFSFFYAGFPIYAAQVLEWEVSQLGLFFMVSSGIMVVVQGPVLSYFSSRVEDYVLVTFGSALIVFSFFCLPLGGSFWAHTANVFLAVGNGLMWPSYLAILSQAGSKKVQGTIQGYANSMGSMASIFALLTGGLLFGQIGPSIFWIAAVLLLVIFFLSFRLRKLHQAD
ncbi:MAG: MFS transporter, partial [Bacteroidota bacterium]